VAATAESLPFEDQSFDAAMALATVDHWHCLEAVGDYGDVTRCRRRVVVAAPKHLSRPRRFAL
jgi:ubiquinone/menaquinone biosynthesis C-methylase UbiE